MAETIFLTVKILGILFIVCKFIHTFAYVSDRDEVIDVMGTSLSLRSGGGSPTQSEAAGGKNHAGN